MQELTTVGIDLAKNVFAVHAVNRDGQVVVRRRVSRGKLPELIAQLPPSLIGMESCTGTHEWARRFQALGHTVRLMAPAFVAPYRKSGKNEANDAEVICAAVSRPNMRGSGASADARNGRIPGCVPGWLTPGLAPIAA
jgi:transposase